ncbi:hypothetical protein [Glycomyces buryatensis]|uniref:Uncharacterized protein n=1 Tax=Glycomyces buryatensis TaxID=2570927 RepID=A0A4S8Q7N4_9ACTN|nr:hypothetical protein [Glycomyces buryatensis]THV40150.1 hypothetical protein FAB82_15750 [Glycomyces buryatensis]
MNALRGGPEGVRPATSSLAQRAEAPTSSSERSHSFRANSSSPATGDGTEDLDALVTEAFSVLKPR